MQTSLKTSFAQISLAAQILWGGGGCGAAAPPPPAPYTYALSSELLTKIFMLHSPTDTAS